MIVTCEGCERRFQVDEARIPERGARVRCKRCNHRFRVTRPGSPAAGADGDASLDGESSLTGAAEATAAAASEAANELRFVTEPPADAAAPAEAPAASDGSAEDAAPPPAPGEQTVGEGSWEFGDSSLSFDEATPPAVTRDPASSQSFIDGIPDDDPPESDPSASSESPFEAAAPVAKPPEPDDPGESSLRAVAPTAGSDSLIFELSEEPDDPSLELADDDAEAETQADPLPVAAAAPSPEAAPEPTVAPADDAGDVSLPEIGSVADWDRLAAEGAPAEPAVAAPTEPEAIPEDDAPFDFGDLDDEDPDPDWPDLGAMPEATAEPPPAARRGGAGWLEHAGWALSVVLLLAVAQGTVRVEPGVPGMPPGQLEVAGLSAEDVEGRFVDNARSGTLFVVSGRLANRSATPARPKGALQLVLLDAEGSVLGAQPVPVGPALPESAVREDPVGALSQRQEARAQELARVEIAPGEGVAFSAVVGDLSERAVRYRIEAATR